MQADLDGQVVIVTGASSGLGRRFAEVLAGAGAHVAAAGRRLDRLTELAGSITEAGGTCVPVRLDVTDDAAHAPAIDAVEEQLGPVTGLVNNAGIPDAQYATRMPVELVDSVLDTNLRAPWLLSCEVARRWIDRKAPGRIVNISSMGAFSYSGGGAALYSVTKAAVNRITEVLAVEWAKFGINVNAIAPGAFHSEMMDGMIERTGGDGTRFFPRGRMGVGPNLDSTLLYLLSPASEFVTGTIVKVDDAQGPR
jgi:NAD(P)-dependent dehydrogenase (short-subunit alcohol dehydrogenase family)